MSATFWTQLADHLENGLPARVVLVAENTRHSPGTRGAKMFVCPNGTQVGTVGGGVMESRFAVPWDEAKGAKIETLSHKAAAEFPSGLICAGAQTMVVYEAAPSHAGVYRDFAHACRDDLELELVVDAGAPTIEASVASSSPAVRLEGSRYREHAVNRKRITIAGGGHCGLALSRAMKQLGYRVHVFDVRPDVFTFEENTHADCKTVVEDYVDVGPMIAHPELSHFVVMTANLPSDVRALLGAMELPLPYKGVMGSSAKLDRIRDELRSHGVSDASLQTLYAPIGLSMASDTPEEIAVSIAAQILRERDKLFPWMQPKAATELS